MKAYLCCIAKNEQPYLQEWIDYHLLVGFDKIIVYDNEDEPSLQSFASSKVHIKHFPGQTMQFEAYKDCISTQQEADYIAFFDVDEFLVLHRHNSVQDFIQSMVQKSPQIAAIGVNWKMFGNNGHEQYVNAPVLDRFTRRCQSKGGDQHVKSIVNPRHVVYMLCHNADLRAGMVTVNTVGDAFQGAFSPPTAETEAVAVLHHYYTKSSQEFYAKCNRGRADVTTKRDFSSESCALVCENNEDLSAIDCRERLKAYTAQSAESTPQ